MKKLPESGLRQIMERYAIHDSSLVEALNDGRIVTSSGERDVFEAEVFNTAAGTRIVFRVLVDTIYSFTLSSAIPNSIWLPLPAGNNTIFPLVKLNSFEHTPLI
jgi:hypothetical protein